MIRWIIGSSMQSRLLIVAIAAVIILFGIMQLRNMPVDVLPEFSEPYVEIQTEALGLSAAELEALITVTLEQDMLSQVTWLKEIRSETMPGLSSIRLTFEPGTDIIEARQVVAEQLQQAFALPKVSKIPAMLQPMSSTSRVLKIGLSSDELSLIDMSVLARWTIKPRLMGVSGVANVAIWGQRKRQLQVQVDPENLRDKGVTLSQIIETAGNALWVSPLTFLKASTPGAGGFIDTPNQRLGIRHILPIKTPNDLAQVTVQGTNMRLGDLAEVVENHQPLIGDAIINDGSGLLLVVERFPWANTLDVTRGVEEALDALRPGLANMNMDSQIYRPATFIENAIDNLTLTLLISAILGLVLLGAFLYNWRTALVSSVAILSSLTAAGFVLYLRGITFDSMVFAGLVIALGAIVDDAIVDVQNIARRISQHLKDGSEKSIANTILEASFEMRRPIIYATVIILLVAVPFFFMESQSGAFFQPIALSYVLALLVSMLVALTLTPALSLMLLSKTPTERSESPFLNWLNSGYNAVISKIVAKPVVVFVVGGVLLLIGILLLPTLKQPSLLPTFKETDLLIKWDSKPATSQPAMSRIVSKASSELRSIPGVRNVSAHVGRAVLSDEAVNVNSSELWVRIDPEADYETTVAAVQEVVNGYPGIFHEVMTYLKERTGDVISRGNDSFVVRIYGNDLDLLRSTADEMKQTLSNIEGIENIHVEGNVLEPFVEIKVKLDAAERYGLKPGDVRRKSAVLLAGIEVGSLFEEQKVFDVMVWSTPETRHSLSDIQNLLIDTPNGGHVRLAEVADVRIVPTPTVIKREAVSRYIDVTVKTDGRDIVKVAGEVKNRLRSIEFPLEYRAELIADFEERLVGRNNMIGFGIAALIGIFLLLQAFLGSWRMATVFFFSLPIALSGGVLTLFASGGIVSIGSLIGFLTVFVIAVRTSIVLIKHYHYLEVHESETFGPDLILRATRERFAPILMTTIITGMAFLPMLFFGDIPGHEIVYPMAIVILGGLVTSTFFTLMGVPILYQIFGVVREPELDLGPVMISTEERVSELV